MTFLGMMPSYYMFSPSQKATGSHWLFFLFFSFFFFPFTRFALVFPTLCVCSQWDKHVSGIPFYIFFHHLYSVNKSLVNILDRYFYDFAKRSGYFVS